MNNLPLVGFVGLGAMGLPMASCLIAQGYRVLGYDTNPERMRLFAEQHGEQTIASLQNMGPRIDVLVMILPSSLVSQTVLFGKQGIASLMKPGGLVIDMTSGVPAMTKHMQPQLSALGLDLLDAPVSGAVARAQSGTLTIMTGGPDALIDRAAPLLKTMGTVTRTGALGSGHAMKALNNLVSCAGFLIGIEALIIGSKFGLDPEVMVDVLNSSTGMNNSTQKKFKQYVLSRKFDSGFPLKMMLKDIEIALGVAGEVNVSAPFAQLCLDQWTATRDLLGPDVDHTAMAKGIEHMAGWEIPLSRTN